MARSRQIFAPGRSFSVKGCFGGSALRSNPKRARPFSSAYKIQVVLRWSTTHQSSMALSGLRRLTEKQAANFGARQLSVYATGATLYVVALWKKRESFLNFLRALAGLMARKILGAERNSPARQACFFHRPFSRILQKDFDAWGAALEKAKRSARALSRNLIKKLIEDLLLVEQGGPPLWRLLAQNKLSGCRW